jgi:putative component of toxin-antitoxin plasmid stabilization module
VIEIRKTELFARWIEGLKDLRARLACLPESSASQEAIRATLLR